MTGPYVHVCWLHPQAATYCSIPWVLWAIGATFHGRAVLRCAFAVCCGVGTLELRFMEWFWPRVGGR